MSQINEVVDESIPGTPEAGDLDLGIVRTLGDLAPDTIVSEAALAKVFARHRVSIKRAVERGELPPPIRLFGEPVWTIRALRDHMAERLDKAKKDTEKMARKIAQLSS